MLKFVSRCVAFLGLISAFIVLGGELPKEPIAHAAFGETPATLLTVTIGADGNERHVFYTSQKTVGEAIAASPIVLGTADLITPLPATPLTGTTFTATIDRAFPLVISDRDVRTTIETPYHRVQDVLTTQNITLQEKDLVTPEREAGVYAGDTISITRAKKVSLTADGKTAEYYTQTGTVQAVLAEAGMTVGTDDVLKPGAETALSDGASIVIKRITFEEKTEEESIAYDTLVRESNQLMRGEEQVAKEGARGKKEITYTLKLEDGKEAQREKKDEKTIREPEPRIIVHGTKEIVAANPGAGGRTGIATFYYGPTNAASNVFPFGTRIRVTNMANGNSVVVTIDDTGSFGDRILVDLRSDYFAELAPLSEGIINIRVEVL